MGNKKVTLSVAPDVYDNYMKYCKENGLILSKQVELMIKEHLKRLKDEGKKRK